MYVNDSGLMTAASVIRVPVWGLSSLPVLSCWTKRFCFLATYFICSAYGFSFWATQGWGCCPISLIHVRWFLGRTFYLFSWFSSGTLAGAFKTFMWPSISQKQTPTIAAPSILSGGRCPVDGQSISSYTPLPHLRPFDQPSTAMTWV